jgi:hypothetical protein
VARLVFLFCQVVERSGDGREIKEGGERRRQGTEEGGGEERIITEERVVTEGGSTEHCRKRGKGKERKRKGDLGKRDAKETERE